MQEVQCWCCVHYPCLNVNFATCTLKNKRVAALDRVCEDFVHKTGLYTNRVIPSYCKNQEKPIFNSKFKF